MHIENMAEEINLYHNLNEVRGDHFNFIKARSNNEDEDDDMIYANMEDIELDTRDKVEHSGG